MNTKRLCLPNEVDHDSFFDNTVYDYTNWEVGFIVLNSHMTRNGRKYESLTTYNIDYDDEYKSTRLNEIGYHGYEVFRNLDGAVNSFSMLNYHRFFKVLFDPSVTTHLNDASVWTYGSVMRDLLVNENKEREYQELSVTKRFMITREISLLDIIQHTNVKLYVNEKGEFHKQDGQAFMTDYLNGNVMNEIILENGIMYESNDQIAFTSYYNDKKKRFQWNYENGVRYVPEKKDNGCPEEKRRWISRISNRVMDQIRKRRRL